MPGCKPEPKAWCHSVGPRVFPHWHVQERPKVTSAPSKSQIVGVVPRVSQGYFLLSWVLGTLLGQGTYGCIRDGPCCRAASLGRDRQCHHLRADFEGPQPTARAGEIPGPGGLPGGGDLKDEQEIGLCWQEDSPTPGNSQCHGRAE